jgi:hypothetical protein
VLNIIISHEQYAYLPKRFIHHGMLLSDEMVYKAKESGKAYVWLKVDMLNPLISWNGNNFSG